MCELVPSENLHLFLPMYPNILTVNVVIVDIHVKTWMHIYVQRFCLGFYHLKIYVILKMIHIITKGNFNASPSQDITFTPISTVKTMVLPWVSVCWPTTALSRTRCPEHSLRRCAYVRPRWGCACHCAHWSYPLMVPPHGSAVHGWHRPNALDGPRCDFAAEITEKWYMTYMLKCSFISTNINWTSSDLKTLIKYWNRKVTSIITCANCFEEGKAPSLVTLLNDGG